MTINVPGLIHIQRQDDVVIASLTGEVDLSNVLEVRQHLLESLPNSAVGCVLDLSETDYLDSKGIQMILDVAYRLNTRQQGMVLVVPEHAIVWRLLVLVSISEAIPVLPSVAEGIQRLRPRP